LLRNICKIEWDQKLSPEALFFKAEEDTATVARLVVFETIFENPTKSETLGLDAPRPLAAVPGFSGCGFGPVCVGWCISATY
jgi:hypothetical protein